MTCRAWYRRARKPCSTGPVEASLANLTLTIEEEVLKRARIRALEEGTSVNALVRAHLERYARDDDQRAALREFVALSQRSAASSGDQGRTWTRDDLYDR